MSKKLDIFRQEFLSANSWVQRKDGVPLQLLDNLSSEELKNAEAELIDAVSPGDTWPIIGLGHIKSIDALPKLYDLLKKTKMSFKVVIAHSVFQINGDLKMIDIVLEEMPKIESQYELIDILYMLPTFKNNDITSLLNNYCNHKEYLVAYNATRALGLKQMQ